MRLSRLFPVFLVLLQSGLAVGHAHAHPACAGHTDAPHLHACELLEFFTPAHHGEHDGENHDADAVDLTDVIASAPPPAPDAGALDLTPVEAGTTLEVLAGRAFPTGLPPSTAGPYRPLYLTLCVLTI